MKNVTDRLQFKNPFKVECFDKDGNLKWSQQFPNGIVDVGMNYLLDAGFNLGSQDDTWAIGLIDNASFSALSNSDTMAAHSGWIENTDYDEANRPDWDSGGASSRSITNAATTDFTMNASVTIKGIFISADNTKGGTTGILWSTALFSSDAVVNSADVLKVTYTING